jgi:D-glycerate 3-kinase
MLALTRRAGQGLPFVLGLCGAQGSGKTTMARAIVAALTAEGVAAAALSLDDLYLTRAEREQLARDVHPLLATRGVPGTHDVGLGLTVFDALARGEAASLPRFDKARDDRAPRSAWPLAPAGCTVLVFEGWCVGAGPQADAALADPVNALERNEDADGRWRAYANGCLGGEYQRLFARIDALALLAAPAFEVVARWRGEQEAELAAAEPGIRTMDEAGIARFVSFYERITRYILAEMPARADLTARLDPARRVLSR